MDSYETLSKIGDGTFGTVYLCRKRVENQTKRPKPKQIKLVAVKKMKKRYFNWDECSRLREVTALKRLNHRNIVSLKEVIRESNNLYLVFDHMEENLYQLMRRQLVPFPESVIRKIVLQIVTGLAYIHKNGFFHRDIKPENLLCQNGPELIKIADFGLTREIDSKPPYTEYVSTRWYRAPELLLHSTNYNWAVDIWAVGCIIGELYTNRPMFSGRSEIDQIFKICQILGPPNTANWPECERLASSIQLNFPNVVPMSLEQAITDCSPVGVNLVKSMLQWSPKDRPKASEIATHCYFKK